MKKKYIYLLVSIICINLNAQDVQTIQSINIIDCPTAAILDKGSFLTGLNVYHNGGLLGLMEVGVTNRIMFGISYGGTNIIGTGPVDWNPRVGVNIRYRLFNEQETFPAICIGYDNQGKGVYVDSLKRYLEKSKGVYAAISKSYCFLGTFAIHAGANYSFENNDGDKDINGYLGFEKSINDELSIFAEYDLAINDNKDNGIGEGKGYLNAGIKWSLDGRFFIDFIWKNILKNNNLYPYSSREIRLNYVEYF